MKLLPITKLLIERSMKCDVLLLLAEWSEDQNDADRYSHFAVENYNLVQEINSELLDKFVNN